MFSFFVVIICARSITNTSVKLINPVEKMINDLKEENKRLLAEMAARPSSGVSDADGKQSAEEINKIKAQMHEMEESKRANERMIADMQKSWEEKIKEATEMHMKAGAGSNAMHAGGGGTHTHTHTRTHTYAPCLSNTHF